MDVRKSPEWESDTGSAYSTAISADGEYIVTGGISDRKVYLFDKDSSTPLWNYYFGSGSLNIPDEVDISANGEFIVVATRNDKIYLFNKNTLRNWFCCR